MNESNRTTDIKNNIYKYLKEGMLKRDSALMAGISEATFYRWMDEDKSFESQVEASILDYKHSLITLINLSAKTDGRLALEVLRRRFPDADVQDEKIIRKIEVVIHDSNQYKEVQTNDVVALPDASNNLNSS